MSYYNFNDHFWSPKTVCSQSVPSKLNKKSTRKSILFGILTIVCLIAWTPLLLKILFPTTNENQRAVFRDNSNLSDNCVLLKTRERFQIYCNGQEQ
ncbi:MAG: hypothetical protein IGS39_04335 [Calothrix sp. C42_A2020_038]|nr:hypothetical protein [Calothrix sp. C42_A2020_038]